MAKRMLTNLRALDLTDEKGFICGKILASLGVEVIKIERPGGDPARNNGPYYGDVPNPEKSLYWFAFNTDKKSITLNLDTDRGRDIFKKLAGTADFIIESSNPGYLNSIGIGYEELCKKNPGLIMVSITHFGQTGPYSSYKSCDLVTSAMSGVMDNTGDPDRPPVKEALDSTYYHANAMAALGALIGHHHREKTGVGQQVDVSIQEASASRCSTRLLENWLFEGKLAKRSGPYSVIGVLPNRWMWPCKDGFLFYYLMGGPIGAKSNQSLSKWVDDECMENPLKQIEDWNEFDRAAITCEMNDAFEHVIGDLFKRHTRAEIAAESAARGVNMCVVNSISDVSQNTQLASRDYWVNINHPGLDLTLHYPKHFFISSETDNYMEHRAPLIGEHNREIYRQKLGFSDFDIKNLVTANVI